MSKATARPTNSKTSVKREDAAFLKLRVEELEVEVSQLKKRLTDLRKAKNTTLLKKEKEYVSTGAAGPKRTHSGDKKVDELQKKLKDLNLKHEQEIGKVDELQQRLKELDLKHDKEMDTLIRKQQEEDGKKSTTKNNPPCNHEPIITKLEKENKDLQLFNDEFQRENKELRNKFEELFTELSIKEAQWCEREEQLNLKLKLQWGEKYKEWMAATEMKIEELQQANTLLRSYLKKPPGD